MLGDDPVGEDGNSLLLLRVDGLNGNQLSVWRATLLKVQCGSLTGLGCLKHITVTNGASGNTLVLGGLDVKAEWRHKGTGPTSETIVGVLQAIDAKLTKLGHNVLSVGILVEEIDFGGSQRVTSQQGKSLQVRVVVEHASELLHVVLIETWLKGHIGLELTGDWVGRVGGVGLDLVVQGDGKEDEGNQGQGDLHDLMLYCFVVVVVGAWLGFSCFLLLVWGIKQRNELIGLVVGFRYSYFFRWVGAFPDGENT